MPIYSKTYERVNWKDYPDRSTSLDEQNLNKMDSAIDTLDDRIVALSGYSDEAKNYADLSKSYAVGTNGEKRAEDVADNAKNYKELAESAKNSAVSAKEGAESAKTGAETASSSASQSASDAESYRDTTQGYMTTTEGYMSVTEGYKNSASQSASDAQSAKTDAESAKSSAESASASASESASSALTTKGEVEQLKTDVVGLKSDVEGLKIAAETASANASTSESNASTYADNASASAEEAKEYAEQASQGVPIATTEVVGKVKPDGTTITVDTDGTIHGASTYELPTASADTLGGIKVGQRLSISGGVLSADEQTITVDDEMSATSTNPVQNKVIYGEIDALKKSVSDGKTLVASAITEKGVATESDATFQTMADNISQIETGGGELHGATISCTTYEETLLGTVATLSLNSEVVQSVTINADGTFSYTDLEVAGTYSIYVTDGTKENTNEVEITAEHIINKTVVSVEVSFIKIVTFADGTDEEITAMLNAHYEGAIDIADYWAVGDTRSVSLSAMSATGVSESHHEDDYEFVIIGIEHDDLVTPINGKTKSAITVNMVRCMSTSGATTLNSDSERGYIYSNYKGTSYSLWSDSPRRTWCNNTFLSALPSWVQSSIKTVVKKTWRYCHSANSNYSSYRTQQSTEDKVFLLSEFEVLGVQGLPTSVYGTVGDDGTQYDYYKTITNRYKYPTWYSEQSSARYWLRSSSVAMYENSNFHHVSYDGTFSYNNPNYGYGLSPALCL